MMGWQPEGEITAKSTELLYRITSESEPTSQFCTVLIMQKSTAVYSVQCSVQCTVYSVQCTVYSARCNACSQITIMSRTEKFTPKGCTDPTYWTSSKIAKVKRACLQQ